MKKSILLLVVALSFASLAQAFSGGSGTVNDPYVISTLADLQAIGDNLGACYVPGGNIDASPAASWNGRRGFIPIDPFHGQLDGRGGGLIHERGFYLAS